MRWRLQLVDFLLIGWCDVTGWCSGNLNHHPSVSSQCGVYVLMVSMQSSPSTCMEVLVPAEQLKDMHRLLCVSLEEELGLCFIAEAIFLNRFSFILSLVTVWVFETQGRPRRLKPLLTNKKQGHGGASVPGRYYEL